MKITEISSNTYSEQYWERKSMSLKATDVDSVNNKSLYKLTLKYDGVFHSNTMDGAQLIKRAKKKYDKNTRQTYYVIKLF